MEKKVDLRGMENDWNLSSMTSNIRRMEEGYCCNTHAENVADDETFCQCYMRFFTSALMNFSFHPGNRGTWSTFSSRV